MADTPIPGSGYYNRKGSESALVMPRSGKSGNGNSSSTAVAVVTESPTANATTTLLTIATSMSNATSENATVFAPKDADVILREEKDGKDGDDDETAAHALDIGSSEEEEVMLGKITNLDPFDKSNKTRTKLKI